MTRTAKQKPRSDRPIARSAGSRASVIAEPGSKRRSSAPLKSVLRQVDQAVRDAYGADTAVKLTIVLETGKPRARIGVEALDPATLPAADVDAERALLGSVLFDNAAFEALEDRIEPKDFSVPLYGRLFEAMRTQWRSGGRLAEPVFLTKAFAHDADFQAAGAVRLLADLVDRTPAASEVQALASTLRSLAIEREGSEGSSTTHAGERALETALAEARDRGAARAADVLAGPDMLSAEDFARLIGVTREAVRQKLKRREVLGLQGAKRGVRYPAWQLTDEGRILTGLRELYGFFGDSAWAVFRFLVEPAAALGGRTPRDSFAPRRDRRRPCFGRKPGPRGFSLSGHRAAAGLRAAPACPSHRAGRTRLAQDLPTPVS